MSEPQVEPAVAVVRDSISSRQDFREFLAADLAAHGLARWHVWDSLQYPELAYQRTMRRVEFLATRRGPIARLAYILNRVRLAQASTRTGLSVPPGVFGRGLSIAHVGSVVVNDNAIVGRYCRIHSATNIGIHAGAAPRIGDFVYIAPGAVIYGDVTVGSRAVVGANSVVSRDIPAGTTAAGAPAVVVSARDSRDVMPTTITAVMEAEEPRP